MKHSKSEFLVSAAVLMAVIGCKGEETELTILHTNDIHLHLTPVKSDPFKLGGLARVSTLLNELRQKNRNSVTLDAGDWSEGSSYYNIDTGANILRAMDMLGYDATTLGNHDFLNGPKRTYETIREAATRYPVLAANLDMSAYDEAETLQEFLPPTAIQDINGVRVGYIGLTTYEFVYDSYLAPVKITNPLDVAIRAAQELRPQVDVLIIISHNTFEMNVQLARAVHGVDVVISGHSHKKVPVARLVKNAGRDVPVVEAGEWAKFVGELKLTVNKELKHVQFKDYQLYPVTSDIRPDPIVDLFIQEQDRLLGELYNIDVHTKVAHTDFELPRRKEPIETLLGNLVVHSYRNQTGADIGLEISNFLRVGLIPGDITFLDIHDIMPHIFDWDTKRDWEVHLWNAKGSDLFTLFEVYYTIAALSPFANPIGWLLVDGAQIKWEPSGKFNGVPLPGAGGLFAKLPIRGVYVNGLALDPRARYKVAIGEGFLFAIRQANEKFNLGLDLSDLKSSGIQNWEAVYRYLKDRGTLSLDELKQGKRIISTDVDLAIHPHHIAFGEGQGEHRISVRVENHGMKKSAAGSLICANGIYGDYVSFQTEEQVWEEFALMEVPALEPNGIPGSAVTLELGFSKKPPREKSGNPLVPVGHFWPIRCEVTEAGDAYLPNNSAERVLHLN